VFFAIVLVGMSVFSLTPVIMLKYDFFTHDFAYCDMSSFDSRRNIMYKHKAYYMYDGMAYYIATLVVDFPVLLVETFLFGVILFWMTSTSR
jgi:hypothetical protein